jgi:crossover junction endodeoxyribonuclease RusA
MSTRATRLPDKFRATTEKLMQEVSGEEHTIYLPYPSSVNRNYRAVNGRVILSKAYREWRKQAKVELMAQRAPKLAGRVKINVILRAPDKRRRDADNLLKSIFDCLKDYGVIEDDSNQIVRSFSVEWDEGAGHPCVVMVRKT